MTPRASVLRCARRAAQAGWAAALLAGLAACVSSAPPLGASVPLQALPAASSAQAAPRFTFAVGDEFDLRVPDAPQFDQTLKVRPDGKFSLPVLGTVQALGRTPEDVQDDLRQRFASAAGGPGQRDYLLQPSDEIELKFPYYPQLNEVLKLRPDGKIQVQLAGTVAAQGLSPEELQGELKRRYARYLKAPELSVIVRSVTTQNVRIAGGIGRAGLANLQPVVIARGFQAAQVFVGGEVGKPGVLAYRPGLSLLQALVESGGQLPTGDTRQLLVLRRGGDDQVQVLHPELSADYLRAPDRDLLLQPFDVVLLPKSDAASLADRLNQYLYNILPPLKNSSLGFSYVLRDSNGSTILH